MRKIAVKQDEDNRNRVVSTKMNPKDRAQRIAALDTIADEAENLAKSGADPVSVQRFAIGARKELAKQKPDKESHVEAAIKAKKAKDLFS